MTSSSNVGCRLGDLGGWAKIFAVGIDFGIVVLVGDVHRDWGLLQAAFSHATVLESGLPLGFSTSVAAWATLVVAFALGAPRPRILPLVFLALGASSTLSSTSFS